MKIRNVKHKGLRRLIEADDDAGLDPSSVDKLRRMISFLLEMDREDELKALPLWRAHRLSGERRGTWSLAVTRNWRLTFAIDGESLEIVDLDFQDYH